MTGYNNLYEFGLDKADPVQRAGSLKNRSVDVLKIDGEVAKTLHAGPPRSDPICFPLEERIYRMRCVWKPGRWRSDRLPAA